MDEKIEMLHKLCKALTAELDEYSKKIEKADGMDQRVSISAFVVPSFS